MRPSILQDFFSVITIELMRSGRGGKLFKLECAALTDLKPWPVLTESGKIKLVSTSAKEVRQNFTRSWS